MEPLLSPKNKIGRPRFDDRIIINGIIYVITTGCKWEDMPRKYGSYKTAGRRLKKWQKEGIWDKIFNFLSSIRNSEAIAIDSSTVEAKKGRINRI
ncbi:MAG: transposase [Candidatus Methanomethylicaceae archaeon]